MLRAIAMAVVTLALVACSNSEGGKMKGGGSKEDTTGQAGDANKTPAAAAAGGTEATGGTETADTTEGGTVTGAEGTGGEEGTDPETAAEGGADPTDEDICKFMRAQKYAGEIAFELAYLCDQGGLAKLRGKADGTMATIVDKQEGGFSHFTFAGAIKTKGNIKAAVKLGNTFCTSFAEYKKVIGEAAFKDVESITPSNKTASGCDHEFRGKKILLFQPSFKGRQDLSIDGDRIAAGANYLVQKISLVEDSVSLNLSVRSGDGLIAYTVQSNVSDTKGFHGTAKTSIIAANETGFKAFAAAMAKGGI